MIFKEGVVWKNMHASMWHARGVVDQASRDMFGRDATLTSARREGQKGLHPKGKAIDIRVWNMSTMQQRAFARLLRERLGPGYDVIVEGPAAENAKYLDSEPHIHVEYEGE